MLRKILATLGCSLILYQSLVFAYWEWTPKTRRWINPKFAVAGTAREQFQVAETARKAGRTEQAIREYQKVLKHFPRSEYAAASHLALAEIYAASGDKEREFQHYQKLITEYPDSDLVAVALKRQTALAEETLKAKTNRFLQILRGKDYLTRKMEQVITNNPFGEEMAERCYQLATFYTEIGEYDKAQETLEKLLRDFPGTRAALQARYQIIEVEYLSIPEVSTDRQPYQRVKTEIEEFLSSSPDKNLAEKAQQLKKMAEEKEAKKLFTTASFYQRSGRQKAARILYEKICQEFPESSYAEMARKKLSSGH